MRSYCVIRRSYSTWPPTVLQCEHVIDVSVNSDTQDLCFVQALVPGLKQSQAQKEAFVHHQMKQYFSILTCLDVPVVGSDMAWT